MTTLATIAARRSSSHVERSRGPRAMGSMGIEDNEARLHCGEWQVDRGRSLPARGRRDLGWVRRDSGTVGARSRHSARRGHRAPPSGTLRWRPSRAIAIGSGVRHGRRGMHRHGGGEHPPPRMPDVRRALYSDGDLNLASRSSSGLLGPCDQVGRHLRVALRR